MTNKKSICNQHDDFDLLLPGVLRPFQKNGVQFLMGRDHVLLADEMGLGKTVQVAVALELLFRRNQMNRALVICPASLKWNWMYELNRWAPSLSVQRTRGTTADRLAYYMLPINVLIASYEEIRNDFNAFPSGEYFDVVILDEAQRIKNPSSKTALACGLLPRNKSWALTGTPLENRLGDLAAIFSFVKFGLLDESQTKSEVHARMKDYFIRRRKKDVATELPPIIEQEIELNLYGEQQLAYNDAWHMRWEITDLGNGKSSSSNMLAVISELKQLCNYDPVSGESVKLDALRLVIESLHNQDDKLLLFSQYVKTLKWLDTQIDGIPRDLFHGELQQDQREEVLSNYRNKPGPRILLMSLRAGGVGLNLQETSTVVVFDRWWNPAMEDQAVQRAHRLGRERPLHVIKYKIRDSIEERICEILHQKQHLFHEYIETAESSLDPTTDNRILELLLSRST